MRLGEANKNWPVSQVLIAITISDVERFVRNITLDLLDVAS